MIQIGVVLVGLYLLFGLLKSILKSRTVLMTAMYLGGYAYYNKGWPDIKTTISSLMGLLHL